MRHFNYYWKSYESHECQKYLLSNPRFKLNKILTRLNKFFEILNAFIKADKKINFPKKNDILIFDRNSHKILEKYVLGHANYEILDVRYESINLSILVKIFI